jgi:hypothetical protein
MITGDESYLADGEQPDDGDSAQTGYPSGGVTKRASDKLRGHACESRPGLG